jgi:leader peptidase (prepilin peptidase) / N-methyltransferase
LTTALLYLALFALGAAIAGQLNRGIYRLAWYPRLIGPWSPPHPQAPPRRPRDRVPVIGWWGLRREAPIHGAGYWVRPLLIELSAGAGFAALYWWEVQAAGLMPPAVPPPFDPRMLHAQYLAHVLLICLMIVATFIDFDEQTIPDSITLPGTLAGLVLMACWPAAALPVAATIGRRPVGVEPLLLTSPHPWPDWLNGPPGLAIGIACLTAWCLAIWPKTVTARRGVAKAVQYLLASMFRYPLWRLILGVLLIGAGLIFLVWLRGGAPWQSLLSALVGMAVGGGLIWAVRIVGRAALGKEAMGFGDVTLMAMIGVYVGWQSSLLIFFMAPFVAVIICLAQWALTRRRDIAFGPYLCGAALILLLGWSDLWHQRAQPVFSLGWLVPQVLFFCLILMAGLLSLWRIIEQILFRQRDGI